MLILTLRTDNPEAEIGIYEDQRRRAYYIWLAHRQLAESIHITVQAMLEAEGLTLQDLQGLIVFKGPGSFTGLRIGASVANALADSLSIPIVATAGTDWLKEGLASLADGKNEELVLPEYGAPARITKQKK